MKKINIENYEVTNPDGTTETFEVKKMLRMVILHPAQKLNATRLLDSFKVVEKIEKAEKHVMLEETEYITVNKAFEKFEGFNQTFVKLVTNIKNPDIVEVK